MKFFIPILIILMILAWILYYYVFTGIIVVTSSRPVDASVQIDGVESGFAPLKTRMRTGIHHIKIHKEGCETWEGEANIKGATPATVSARLRFWFQSDPPGAKVKINGKEVGVTDLALDLRPGLYEFELRKSGYRKSKFKATIPLDVSQSLPFVKLDSAKATPPEEQIYAGEQPSAPEYGSIQVTSTPDAQVFLDGEPQGETPLTIKKVLVGSYVLKLSKEGYRDLRQTVYVNKGEKTKVAGELKQESQ